MKIKKIVRSKRKTIALQVCSDTSLIIRAPFHATDEVIERVILKHNKWLEKKRKEIILRDLKYPAKRFSDGEKFFFLGEEYRLHQVKEQEEPLILRKGHFLLIKNLNNPRDIFINWYKKMARATINQRVVWFAHRWGFRFNKITITNAQKQWGSCSHLGNLNFSWRLILAPLVVIDYVVIHELVHLDEKNHSKKFWKKVEKYFPEYKIHREWLKKNGCLLRF